MQASFSPEKDPWSLALGPVQAWAGADGLAFGARLLCGREVSIAKYPLREGACPTSAPECEKIKVSGEIKGASNWGPATTIAPTGSPVRCYYW